MLLHGRWNMRIRAHVGLVLAAVVAASGCSHALEIKNIGLYKPTFISNRSTSARIGLSAVTSGPEEERLVMGVANAMKRDGFLVTYPFFPSEQNKDTVDFLVKLNTASEYKGSGWNFLINWPGFLIWAPAWHGYNYRVIYTFDADITNSQTGTQLPRLSVPVDLEIRHADIGRTWTEISWFEWSLIAFAGGLVFIRYDHDLTPQVVDATEHKIADYVASKVGAALLAAREDLAFDGGRSRALRLHRLVRAR